MWDVGWESVWTQAVYFESSLPNMKTGTRKKVGLAFILMAA